MLVRGLPKWVLWLMNLAVIGVLIALAYSLKWAGTEFCVGLIAGFTACYVLFRCWRFDYHNPTEELPQLPQQQPYLRDQAQHD